MQVRELQNPDVVFETIIAAVIRLAEHGLIHCDFNEFNIMVSSIPSLIYLRLSLYLTAIFFCSLRAWFASVQVEYVLPFFISLPVSIALNFFV